MKNSKFKKILSILLCVSFLLQQTGFAQVASVELNLSSRFASAGSALSNVLSPDKFRPVHLRSISYDQLNNNFKLLIDKGDTKNPKTTEIESTTKDLLNYFFVGIALPNSSFWVNLRPDAPTNIIDPLLAQTEVGKILLEADLQLKKDTAEATNPQSPEGKAYWNKLYAKANELYGNQNVNIPTLTRPWIVPDEIIIRESTNNAYVYKATLKVMLEQDYLKDNSTYSFKDDRAKQLNEYSSQIIRQEIIPKLTKEINSAKRYAQLRQVYYSLILAQWFKARNSNNSNNSYAQQIDRKDLTNLRTNTPYSVDTYFNSYKQNFTQGQYNIKEPVYTPYGQVVRSYFSGGAVLGETMKVAQFVPSKDNAIEMNKSYLYRGNFADFKINIFAKVKSKDRTVYRVKDYKRINQAIENIIKRLKNSIPLKSADMDVVVELMNRLIMKNYLLALDKVSGGDVIITNSQPGIKFFNTNLGDQVTNWLIEERKVRTIRLLIEEELISSQDTETLLLSYKQDKFVIKKKQLEKLGSNTQEQEAKVSAKLIKIKQKLSDELKQLLEDEYKGKEEYSKIKNFVFDFQFGISAPVRKNNLDAKISADIQALQATKVAKIYNKAVDIYRQEDIERLISEAENYLLELGVILDDEILGVRGKTEDQLQLEFIVDPQKAKRMVLLKKYLMIIDIFDCQTLSRMNLLELETAIPRIKSILGRLENIIQKTGTPEVSIATLRETSDLLEISSKNPDILSGEAFLGVITDLLTENGKGMVLSFDKINFYLENQRTLMNKPGEYIKQLDYADQQALINKYQFYPKQQIYLKQKTLENRWGLDNPEIPLMLVLVLDTEDSIKGKMLETTSRLIKITRGAIPTENLDGRERSVVNQEGGDEIVCWVPEDFDLIDFTKKLAEANLNVRAVAAEVRLSQGKRSENLEVDLIKKAYAAVSHDAKGVEGVGQAHDTINDADKLIKQLEIRGVYGVLVSSEYDANGNLEWVVYTGDERVPYDDFYADIAQNEKIVMEDLDAVLTAGENIMVTHRFVNSIIRSCLPEDLRGFADLTFSQQEERKNKYRNGIGKADGQIVIPIKGLFTETGAFAQIGLGQFYGEPVIYIDEMFYSNETDNEKMNKAVTDIYNHERYEIRQWEKIRMLFGENIESKVIQEYKQKYGVAADGGLSYKGMRTWIKLQSNTRLDGRAQILSQDFHNQATKVDYIYDWPEMQMLLQKARANIILQNIGRVFEKYEKSYKAQFKEKLGIDLAGFVMPRVFMTSDEDAFISAHRDTSILLRNEFAALLSDDELTFALAHEYAHIQINHYMLTENHDQNVTQDWMQGWVLKRDLAKRFKELDENLGLMKKVEPRLYQMKKFAPKFYKERGFNLFVLSKFKENQNYKDILEASMLKQESVADHMSNLFCSGVSSGLGSEVLNSTFQKLIDLYKIKLSNSKQSKLKGDDKTDMVSRFLEIMLKDHGKYPVYRAHPSDREREDSSNKIKVFSGWLNQFPMYVNKYGDNDQEEDVLLAAELNIGSTGQKLNRPLILDKNGLVAHGTNAYALVQAMDTDRQLRPAKDGEVRFSGESFGSTALNKKGVSVILLNLLANNPLSTVNNYARESASAEDSLVTLDNIKEKIRKINKAIEIKRKEMRSLKKNNVDPAILAWQQYSIDSLESIRPALISVKNKLKIMTKSQYEEYLQLSQISVCIAGEGISRLPVKSGIRNEGVFEKVNIRVAGVRGAANVEIVKSYLATKGVNDIIVVELGELEKWVEEYNKKDDASDGEDTELVKNIRKAINLTVAADLSSAPVKVFDPNSKVVNNVAPGGIDFRFLPIITESMGSLKASMRGISVNSLQRINLTKGWSDIERLVNSGIVPSTDRLKEYFAASNLKGNLDNDMQKIVSCISDILRMEEESDTLTNPTLKDMLVVLNSGKSGEELKLAFTN